MANDATTAFLERQAELAASTHTVRRRLRQDSTWTDREGVEHAIAEMEPPTPRRS